MHLFRDHSIDRISAQGRRGQVRQQHRIDGVERRRRDGVAESDIDLGPAACFGKIAIDQHARTAVARVLSDGANPHAVGIESNAVVGFNGGDLHKRLLQRLQVAGAEAEQVRIAGSAVRLVIP